MIASKLLLLLFSRVGFCDMSYSAAVEVNTSTVDAAASNTTLATLVMALPSSRLEHLHDGDATSRVSGSLT